MLVPSGEIQIPRDRAETGGMQTAQRSIPEDMRDLSVGKSVISVLF